MKKKKPKKTVRVDTTRGAQLALRHALAGTVHPPAHVKLRKCELPFWKSIVDARAAQLWKDSDLELAAHLARDKYLLEKYRKDMEHEPLMKETRTGRTYRNPKLELIETISRRIMSMSRMLHVHAQTTVGRPADGAKKLDAEQEAKRKSQRVYDDGLIPFPRRK